MTVDFIQLNVDEILSMFKIEDGRIYRVSDNERFDGLDVTDQKLLRVGEQRTTVARIKYILENEILPVGEVILNDNDVLVDTTDNALRTMLGYRYTDNVRQYETGFFGRYTNSTGTRVGRRFDTYNEAKEFAKDMTKSIWSEKASELGFKL